jgi:hydroxyquinol 1,2-dioxygenase
MSTANQVSADDHLAQVLASFDGAPDPRAREILQAAVRHLHAFVTEIRLTREEWAGAIAFLTAVGQKCDETRQEFILLSDTLGVSMLVEMLNQQASPGCTEPTVLGPFYVEGAPARANGETIAIDPQEGEPLVLTGEVRSIDGTPLAGATLDIWQVQPSGLYDVQEYGEKRNLRGLFTTDDNGHYRVGCVRPVDYCIPDDGPVGKMLRAGGREAWRPAHIHLIVRAEGHKPLITHVFDAASRRLNSDAVFGTRPSLVVDMSSAIARFDVVLEPLANAER